MTGNQVHPKNTGLGNVKESSGIVHAGSGGVALDAHARIHFDTGHWLTPAHAGVAPHDASSAPTTAGHSYPQRTATAQQQALEGARLATEGPQVAPGRSNYSSNRARKRGTGRPDNNRGLKIAATSSTNRPACEQNPPTTKAKEPQQLIDIMEHQFISILTDPYRLAAYKAADSAMDTQVVVNRYIYYLPSHMFQMFTLHAVKFLSTPALDLGLEALPYDFVYHCVDAFFSNQGFRGRPSVNLTYATRVHGWVSLFNRVAMRQPFVLGSYDPATHRMGYQGGNPRLGVGLTLAAQVGMYPYKVRPETRAAALRALGPRRVALLVSVLVAQRSLVHNAGTLGVPLRGYRPTPAMAAVLAQEAVAEKHTNVLFVLQHFAQMEANALGSVPKRRGAVVRLFQEVVGFMPGVLCHVYKLPQLRVVLAVLQVLLDPACEMFGGVEARMLLAVVAACAYRAPYLARLFLYLAARATGMPERQLIETLRPALTRVTTHHTHMEAALAEGSSWEARRASPPPTAHLPLPPGQVGTPLVLEVGAEMAQPVPMWPPGFLSHVAAHLGPPQVDHIRTVISWAASLTALEGFFTVAATES